MSTSNKITSVLAVLAVIVSVFSLSGYHFNFPSGGKVSAVGTGLPIENYIPSVLYNGGLVTNLPAQFGIGSTAGSLTLNTSNSATSTASLGCIQTVATSTASPIVLTFATSFTGTTTFPTGLATGVGLVAWKFGTCPSTF